MKSTSDSLGLKVLCVFGAIGLAAIFIAPLFFAVFNMRRQASVGVAPSAPASGGLVQGNGFLGELGSACGGEKRLPCRPGTMCSVALDGKKQGTCVKDERAPMNDLAQFGQPCSAQNVCAPGLSCRPSSEQGGMTLCAKLNENSPFIVSVKPEGMIPEAGVYHASVGTKVHVVIQTTNIERAQIILQGKVLGEATKDEGGKYGFDFVVPEGLDGDLRVTVFQGKEFSSLALRVAAD